MVLYSQVCNGFSSLVKVIFLNVFLYAYADVYPPVKNNQNRKVALYFQEDKQQILSKTTEKH